jgi:heterotetrameric sarcosine oxidase gamma subunit
MLKASSALLSAKPYVSSLLAIAEAPDFTLTQYAGSDRDLKNALGKLPAMGKVLDGMMRISPNQFLAVQSINRHSREDGNLAGVYITELSSSRTRIEITGAPARDVLAKCAAIDFHKSEFKPNAFAMTGIHHVPVLIHCVDADIFHIYVTRTFALSIWDHITDAALEYA